MHIIIIFIFFIIVVLFIIVLCTFSITHNYLKNKTIKTTMKYIKAALSAFSMIASHEVMSQTVQSHHIVSNRNNDDCNINLVDQYVFLVCNLTRSWYSFTHSLSIHHSSFRRKRKNFMILQDLLLKKSLVTRNHITLPLLMTWMIALAL